MKLFTEISSLDEFKCWSGAQSAYDAITGNRLGVEFIKQLEDEYPDGISDDKLNNLLWFEPEYCLHLVGLKTEEELDDEYTEHLERIEEENGWIRKPIPDWAICPLEYGDYSDLDDEEISLVESFRKCWKFKQFVSKRDGSIEEPYFTNSPAFGNPCNVMTVFVKKINTYSVWSVDCFGNEEDGWDFNDRSKTGYIECTDDEIEEEFIRQYAKGIEVYFDWYDETSCLVNDKSSDKILFEIELED